MFSKLLLTWALMAVCVVIHASGVAYALRWVRRHPQKSPGYWHWTGLFVGLAGWMMVLHLTEISVWAFFYVWKGAMPDLQSSLYFSVVTYTTTGYGDLVLPEDWRLVGAIEALTGILMCGLSTGFFWELIQPFFRQRSYQRSRKQLITYALSL